MGWRELEALNDHMVFAAYEEEVRHSPLKNGLVDPGRPVALIKAILHHPGIDGQLSLGGGMLTSISASKHYLVVERSKYPDLAVASKDKFRAMSRPGTPAYEVSKINDRHSGILIFDLNEA